MIRARYTGEDEDRRRHLGLDVEKLAKSYAGFVSKKTWPKKRLLQYRLCEEYGHQWRDVKGGGVHCSGCEITISETSLLNMLAKEVRRGPVSG